MASIDILKSMALGGSGGGGITPSGLTWNDIFGGNFDTSVVANTETVSANDDIGLCLNRIVNISSNRGGVVRDSAFSKAANLETVTLPNCTGIEDSAFNACAKLRAFEAPAVATVGMNAWAGSGIITMNLPACASIGYGALAACHSLTRLDLGPGCVSIGSHACYGCLYLETVIVRNATAVPTLGNNAFSNTSNTLSIYVPDIMLEQYKTATNWSQYTSQIKGLSELPA